jgi:hypothetical protein
VPLSRDPELRAKQLRNLKRGGNPAPSGNGLAVRHGGYAAVTAEERDEELRRIREALAEDRPLKHRADDALLDLLADSLVQLRRVRRDIADHGWKDPKTGEPRPVVGLARSLRREAAGYLAEMGMSPASRVRLGVDLARGLDLPSALSAAREERDPQVRRALLAAAGLVLDDEESGG